MKKITLFIILIAITSFAQQRNPFYLGHSLLNFDMPAMVDGLAASAGKTSNYDQQIINGSPLQYNYNNHATAEGTSFRTAFPNGGYNTFVITEAIPLKGKIQYNDTYKYANIFYDFAKKNNNNIPVKFYVYETWHCTTTGTKTGCPYDDDDSLLWQPRLIADLPLWTGIVNDVRSKNPTESNIFMVPAGQAMYKLTNSINAGNLPGISNFTDLFRDDIHLTNKGNYFVACVMYATIFGESPVGLSTDLKNKYGDLYTNMPTQQQALVMQQVAWETVTEMSNLTGVSKTLSTQNFDNLNKFTVSPNPVSNNLLVNHNFTKNVSFEIYNQLGKLVKTENLLNNNIDVTNLSAGFYFLKMKSENEIFTQKFIKQ
jgi:hypothetical protein